MKKLINRAKCENFLIFRIDFPIFVSALLQIDWKTFSIVKVFNVNTPNMSGVQFLFFQLYDFP